MLLPTLPATAPSGSSSGVLGVPGTPPPGSPGGPLAMLASVPSRATGAVEKPGELAPPRWIETAGAAIVQILASREDPSTTTTRWTVAGLGFVVDARGYVLTHYGVVRDARALVALLADGRRFTVTRVWRDDLAGVAVLRIEGRELPVLSLGESRSVRVGDAAVIVGWPTSGPGRGSSSATIAATGAPAGGDLAIDPPVGAEYAGSPLVNARGQVIGIASAETHGPNGGLTGGHAIPIDRARGTLEQAWATAPPRSVAPPSSYQ
jgi:S1-C subfamily serine protease